MARYRVFIKTFEFGDVYASDFTEISPDVLKLGSITQQLDNNEYDIGIFKNSTMNITLRNDHGKYSNVGEINTIFKFKRVDSILKITWDFRDTPLIAGFFTGNEVVGGEVTLFEGLLNDVSLSSKIDEQDIQFKVLGFESKFDATDVPFTSISNGDLLSVVIFKMLNQTEITTLVTVDQSNIVVGQDETIDDKSSLENKTVKEALKELLLGSNAVLFIRDNTIFVSARTESAELKFTFFGQAADDGIENTIDIQKFRDGLNRVRNFWTWADTTLVSQDPTSIDDNGLHKKEIDIKIITNTAKRQNFLDTNKDEFRNPKTELELMTDINYDTLELFLLDKVSIDYPTSFSSADSNVVPRWGAVIWNSFKYAIGQYALTIDSQDRFKILSRKIDTKKQMIIFGLRKVG